MFGIGFQEMLVILVVVLIFFGPKRLPDLAKSLGKGIAEFKKASDEVRQGINEAMKEETAPKDETAAKDEAAPTAETAVAEGVPPDETKPEPPAKDGPAEPPAAPKAG